MSFDEIIQSITRWLSGGSLGIFGGIFGIFGLGLGYMIIKKKLAEAASNSKLKNDASDAMNQAQDTAVQTSKDMDEAEYNLRAQDAEDEKILRGKKP